MGESALSIANCLATIILAQLYAGDGDDRVIIPPLSEVRLFDGPFKQNIDQRVVATQVLDHNKPGHFFEIDCPIVPDLIVGKNKIVARFQLYAGNVAAGLLRCAAMKIRL